MPKAKAFSRIFSAAEVKKGLLSDDFDNIPEGPSGKGGEEDDDGFPIDIRSSQAHRASSADDLGFPEYDDQGFGVVNSRRSASDSQFPEAMGAFDSSFVASEGGFDDFGDAGAFEGDNSNNSGKLLVDFGDTAADEEEEDDEFQVDDAVVEAAFQASFSGLEAAAKAAETQSPAAGNGKKVKKRLTRIFKSKKDDKPEEPVSRCGEIVVDKSKIPTTKVDMDIVNGQLVAKRDGLILGQEEEEKDKTKNRSTFKSIKKYAKKRAEEMGVLGPKEGLDSSISSEKGLDNPEGSETANDNSEEAAEDAATPATDEVRRGDPRQRRRRRSLTEGEMVAGSQRDRGERRRRGEKGGAGGRLTGGKTRSNEENGTRPRRSRTSNKDGGEIRFRRNLTSDSGLTEKGRRRQSLIEKHAPKSDLSPRRSNRPRDGLDESNRRTIDESHRRRHRGDGMDASTRRGGKGSEMDASTRRGGKAADMDASNRRGERRSHGSRREPRKSMRRAISTDETGEIPRRPSKLDGNNLSATSHGPMRRSSTMDSSAMRRAQSTRRLGKNDLMGESGHKVASGLTDRERLRRATMVGDNKNNNVRQGLGSLYGGRAAGQSSESEDEDEGELIGRPRFGSDGDILEEEDESENSGGAEPGNNAEGEETFAAVSGISLLASGKLTSNDVEKLVKAVVRKAEDAKDEEEVEAIVMETLHQSSAVGFDMSIANLIDEDLDISVDSEVSLEEDTTKGGLNRKDVHNRTRNYVNVFLKSGLAGGDGRVGKLVASKLGGHNDGEMLEGIDESECFDEDAVLDESNDCSIDEGAFLDDESNNKHGSKKMSRENLAEKMQAVKAAKALGTAGTKDGTKQKPDFSAVASRLEAKAEAKTKARMRNKVAK